AGHGAEGTKGAERQGRLLALSGCGIALLAVAAAIIAGLGHRFGLWSFRTGFSVLRWGVYGGVAATLLGLAAILPAVRSRRPGTVVLALLGVAGGLTIVAIPVSWRHTAASVPPIHDITTDIDHPPQFVAILPLRAAMPNPAAYGGAEVAVKQRSAYPDIRTVILNVPREQAFTRALDVARVLGWQIVAAVPAEGRIEATDTTFWFGFTDDIVIRVTAADYRSLVDIRSVSREGRSDVGTNAKRIRAFVRKLTG
ncbi:MAG TPA: DUF1499 domain-containing protein, partial [Geobacteraceae bacterium]